MTFNDITYRSTPNPQDWSYLASYSSEMLWMTDADNYLLWINRPWSDFTDIPQSIDVPCKITDLIQPVDLEHVLYAYAQSLENKQPFRVEYRIKLADDTYAWVSDRVKPRFDEHQAFIGFIGCCTDIEDIKKSAQNIDEFEKDTLYLLNWAKELQHVTTFKQALSLAAKAMQEHVGYSSAVLYLKPEPNSDYVILINAEGGLAEGLTRHYPTLTITGDKFMEEVFSARTPYVIINMREDPRTNKEIVTKLGLWTTINIPIILHGQYLGTLSTGSYGEEGIKPPSSRQIRLMEQMTCQIAPVVERIFYLDKKIEIENELRMASDAKSEFLSRMSHELRTPLNAVLGFSQLLMYDKTLSGGNQATIKDIYNAGQHLLDLVNDVLDLSNIEKGKIPLNPQQFSPEDVILEAISLNKSLAEDRNVQILFSVSASSNPFCFADPLRFKQVVLNLLSNAIKYNKKNGIVSIGITKTDKETVKISVKDTGIGITLSDIHKIFEPFERFVTYKNTIEGFGIGLSITKSLIELMGSKIEVESEPGKGSEFWFTLPISSDK